jgi:hypothetical protein
MSDLAVKIENARKDVADLKAKIKQNRKNKQDAEREFHATIICVCVGRGFVSSCYVFTSPIVPSGYGRCFEA